MLDYRCEGRADALGNQVVLEPETKDLRALYISSVVYYAVSKPHIIVPTVYPRDLSQNRILGKL